MTDAAGTILVMPAGGTPTLVPVSSLSVPLQVDVLVARLAAAEAAAVLLAQRVAALEGKPDPCVALAGVLPIAALQMGSTDVAVPVPGLLPVDRVSVELLADLPGGLVLGSMRSDPKTPGVLLVQATATLSMTGKAAVPLAVTALR